MALVEPLKKGGRYTKKEQEERRLQVYQFHFEENKSAVEISEELNVNRNTVNDDIKFLRTLFGSNSNGMNIVSQMKKKILELVN